MSEVTITRHLAVLHPVNVPCQPNHVPYGHLPEDGGDVPCAELFYLDREDWTEMGCPEAITVAVWPGDRQDLMESDLEQAQAQIDRLATFIMDVIDGEPSESEGAIDTAIRLLDKAYGPPPGVDASKRA